MLAKISSIIEDMIKNRLDARELFNRLSMGGLGEPGPNSDSIKLSNDFSELQEELEKSLGATTIARDILSGMDFGQFLGAWMTRTYEKKSDLCLAYINAVMAFEALAYKEENLGTSGAYRTDRERIRDKMKKVARVIKLLEEKLDIG